MGRKPLQKPQTSHASDLIDQLIATHSGDKQREIVDIITFCESPLYLNFLGQDPPIVLWPMQRVVLKMFYRGTKGNEHIYLTDKEIELLKSINDNEELDYDRQVGGFNQVIDKYKRGGVFCYLLLIMGRRSSKTMMVSIIAAYEAYKLCECPEGNPHKAYNIPPDKPIHIINMAVSEAQALDPLFAEIEARMFHSPYFKDKINHESSIKGKLYVLTDADKRENARRSSQGIKNMQPGSIILLSGHSNAPSLRGHATICLLLDEFAHFTHTTGKSSGDAVLNAMLPSMRQFGKDGRVALLSDPVGKEGMFWKLFQFSQKRELKNDGTFDYPYDDYLALQLPTWRINPNVEFSKETLEKTERAKDPSAFATSWNARFVGAAGHKFFDVVRLENCIEMEAREVEYGNPGNSYFIHLDPATTSHNYALCMVHTVTYINEKREVKRKVFVDTIKFWKPDESGPVNIKEVEDNVRLLCRKFRVSQVTFDAFQSAQTIENLKRSGIRAFETAYRSGYISDIYGELRTLVNNGDLVLYPHAQLIGEMRELMYKPLSRGIKTFFDPKSEYPSDDCVDALAGAAYQAMHSLVVQSLPRSVLVYTGAR